MKTRGVAETNQDKLDCLHSVIEYKKRVQEAAAVIADTIQYDSRLANCNLEEMTTALNLVALQLKDTQSQVPVQQASRIVNSLPNQKPLKRSSKR